MEYKIVELAPVVAYGKTFEFPTAEIGNANYQGFYEEVCTGKNPNRAYGVYEIGMDNTKFSVATDIETEKDQQVTINGGTYFEFEIDLMKHKEEDQYTLCYTKLEEDGHEVDMSYSFEASDQSYNPATGEMLCKFYIKE